VLAELLAADFLPSVWVADEGTQVLRREVARCAQLVRQRTRLKNQVQAILHRNLIERCPFSDLFGVKGRHWLQDQHLPLDEQQAVGALMRQLDFHGQELRIIDASLGRIALERSEVTRLMTIPGVDATVSLSLVAAVGDFRRFQTPEQLVSYLGLNPRVKQSRGKAANHGRITRRTVARMPAGCSWRPRSSRPRSPARCGRSINASAHGAARRSRSSRPPASSRCCAGR
jgi:transposase